MTRELNTLKHSNICLSDDDVVFKNNSPGTINQNEDKEGSVEFTATFMHNDFELVVTP